MSGSIIVYPQRLENPSFERGLLTDFWVVETDGASGGSYTAEVTLLEKLHRKRSLKLTADDPTGSLVGVYQDQTYPTLEVGQEYTLRAYVKGSGTLFLEVVELVDASAIESDSTSQSFVSLTNSWQAFTVTHTIVDASAQLRARVQQTSPGETLYVDFVVLGRVFDVLPGITRFDSPNRVENEQETSSDGTVETLEEYTKDDVTFGWKNVFPALLDKIELLWEETRGGAPFALLFDPDDVSEDAWPQLVMTSSKNPRKRKSGVRRFTNEIFKSTELHGID